MTISGVEKGTNRQLLMRGVQGCALLEHCMPAWPYRDAFPHTGPFPTHRTGRVPPVDYINLNIADIAFCVSAIARVTVGVRKQVKMRAREGLEGGNQSPSAQAKQTANCFWPTINSYLDKHGANRLISTSCIRICVWHGQQTPL